MGGDDVAHVGGGEAERLELPQRGRLAPSASAFISAEDGAELARVAGVLDAEAGVDQDQAVAALDRQAVADDFAAVAAAHPRRRAGGRRGGTATRS